MKYKSSDSKKNTIELKDSRFSSSEGLHFLFGFYLIYKEFEYINIKDIEFNNEDPILDLQLKKYLIITKLTKDLGGFSDFNEMTDSFNNLHFLLITEFSNIFSHDDFSIFIEKFYNDCRKKYNFKYLSVKKFQKFFYISSYYKNVNVEKMRSYWNKDKKEYSFFEFIDNLELDDKDLIYELKYFNSENDNKNDLLLDKNKIYNESIKEYILIIYEYFKKEKIAGKKKQEFLEEIEREKQNLEIQKEKEEEYKYEKENYDEIKRKYEEEKKEIEFRKELIKKEKKKSKIKKVKKIIYILAIFIIFLIIVSIIFRKRNN